MRSRVLPVGSLLLVTSLLTGCRGKLIATAQLTQPGTAETKVAVSGKKRLALWADTDGKWNGSKDSRFDASYEIDVLQGGATVAHVSCSTMDHDGTTVCGTHTTINANHDADCEIALGCKLPPLVAGEAQLKVTGRVGPTVKQVRKMSINVREE
jgi:hypothetical protein